MKRPFQPEPSATSLPSPGSWAAAIQQSWWGEHVVPPVLCWALAAALGGVTNMRARQVGSLDQKSWVGLSREEKDLPRPQGAPCSGCAQANAEKAAQGTYLLIFSRRGWASSYFCEMYNFKM